MVSIITDPSVEKYRQRKVMVRVGGNSGASVGILLLNFQFFRYQDGVSLQNSIEFYEHYRLFKFLNNLNYYENIQNGLVSISGQILIGCLKKWLKVLKSVENI